ncbi:MAG: hypothetical protein FWG62_03225, partial [Proteobacteria bacterium]|nr:hypothetical protein [Pseudomonadota bacterium]
VEFAQFAVFHQGDPVLVEGCIDENVCVHKRAWSNSMGATRTLATQGSKRKSDYGSNILLYYTGAKPP